MIADEENDIEQSLLLPSDSCCICLEDVTNDDKIQLKCDHVFHSSCFSNYIYIKLTESKTELTCPLCRNILYTFVYKSKQIKKTKSCYIYTFIGLFFVYYLYGYYIY